MYFLDWVTSPREPWYDFHEDREEMEDLLPNIQADICSENTQGRHDDTGDWWNRESHFYKGWGHMGSLPRKPHIQKSCFFLKKNKYIYYK